MPNFADLILGADTTGLAKGEAALTSIAKTGAQTEAKVTASMDGIGHSAELLAAAVRSASSTETLARIAAAQEAQSAADRVIAAAQARQRAEQAAADAIARAARQEAAAREAAASSYSSLRASLDPAYAATLRYERAVETTTAAVKMQIITQEQANSVLGMAEKQMVGVEKSGFAAGGGVRMLGQQLSQVAQQGAVTGNYLGAMAVQLPDMALGFGSVAVAASIVATVALPAIMSALGSTASAEEKAADQMDILSSTLSEFNAHAELGAAKIDDLRAKYGQWADEIQATAQWMAQVNTGQALEELSASTMSFSVALDEVADAQTRAVEAARAYTEAKRLSDAGTGDTQAVQNALDAYGLMNDQVNALADGLGLTAAQAILVDSALASTKGSKSMKELADNATKALDVIHEMYPAGALLPPELAKAADQLENVRNAASQGVTALGDAADNAEGIADALNTINWDAAKAGAISLAAQLGVSLDVATALNATLDRANGTGKAKPVATAGGLSFGVDPVAVNKVTAATLSFADATDLARMNADAAKKEALALAAGLGGGSGGSGGVSAAAKDAAKSVSAMASEIKALEFKANPILDYNEQLARLNELAANGLSDGAYRKAVDELNDSFSNSSPAVDKVADAIGNFVASGMQDFKSLLGAFKSMITEMIATAIANPIKLALGMTGGMGGSAASAATGADGGGAGGILGSIGGIGGAFSSGLSSVWSALGTGGLSGAAGAISTAVSGITLGTGALASFATAIGAIALPVAAVAAVFSFFKTKTKELDAGMRITADTAATLVEEYKTIQKTKFWGLSKKTRTNFTESDNASPITAAIESIKTQGMALGEVLGLTAANFASFSSQIKFSLAGMSDAEAQAEIQRVFGVLADDLAYAALGSFQVAMGNVIKDGETASAAMERLVNSLVGVNDVATLFGSGLLEMSVAGGVAASALVDLTGGLDNFNSKAAYVFSNMLTDTEQKARKVAIATDQLNAGFGALGISIPQTHAQYMSLLNAQDLMTTSGRTAYSALLNLASAFVEVNGTAQAAVDLGGSLSGLGSVIAEVNQYFAAINAQMFGVSSAGQTMAASLVALLGGIEGFNSATAFFTANFYSEAEQLQAAANGLNAQFAALNLATPPTVAAFRKLVEAQDLTTSSGQSTYAALMKLAPAFMSVANAAASAANTASAAAAAAAGTTAPSTVTAADVTIPATGTLADAQAAALAAQKAISDMAAATAAAAKAAADAAAKAAADAARKAASQSASAAKAATAAQIAADQASERYGLETKLLDAQGQTAALRKRELDALYPANRALQTMIWSLEDAAVKADKAKAIADERYSWETKYLTAIGDTAALRERELATIDPANRAYAAMVMSLEDAATSMSDLTAQADKFSAASRAVFADDLQVATRRRDMALAELNAQIAAGQIQEATTDRILEALSNNSADQYSNVIDFERARAKIASAEMRAANLLQSQAAAGAVTQAQYMQDQLAIGNSTVDLLGTGFGSVSSAIEGLASSIAAWLSSMTSGSVPGFAGGGVHRGGLRVVGENGPELEYTPPSRIFSNSQSQDMLAGDPAVREELVKLNEYIRELVKLNVKQERRLREIELQGEVAV